MKCIYPISIKNAAKHLNKIFLYEQVTEVLLSIFIMENIFSRICCERGNPFKASFVFPLCAALLWFMSCINELRKK